MTPVWVVEKQGPDGWSVVSAWADVYAAKHEAMRWEQDTKVPHRYSEGWICHAPHAAIE